MNAHRRLQNLLAYGQTTAAMDDAGATPLLQAQFGDLQVLSGLQLLAQFGFSSSPPVGTNLAALFAGGDKSRGVILGTVNPGARRRMLVTGETTIYDVWGNEVHLSQAAATVKHSTQVIVTCPNTTIQGNLRVQGAITCTEEVTAQCDGGASVTLSRHHGHTNSIIPPTPGT